MRKISFKTGGICVATAAAIACLGVSVGVLADGSPYQKVTDNNRSALLGLSDPDAYFLGAASQFSVFVEEDFAAYGSDCEGRLAAGGNANMGDIGGYHVGSKLDDGTSVAHVVVGGDTLKSFQPNGKNFVIANPVTVDNGILEYAEIGQCNVYTGEIFDFAEEFERLRNCSRWLADQTDNAILEIDPHYIAGWTVRGSDPVLNILTLTAQQVEEFNEEYIQFSIYIPEGSYLVINVEGDAHVDMPGNNVRFFEEDGTQREVDPTMVPVLYNLADATSFKYLGSLTGSTLAPNADGSGDEGGHVTGSTFAKSFSGGIEFGYSFFNLPDVGTPEVETTTTEETTTTTTTTTEETTTTTTTTTEETTTTTTTTTTEETTTTTTTTTTEETTTTTTTTTTEEETTTTTTTTTTEETTTTTTEKATTEEETTTETAVSAEEETTTTTQDDSSLEDEESTTEETTTEETTTTTEETTTTTEETTTTTEETTTTTEETTTTTEETTTTTEETTTTTEATTTTDEGTGSPETGDSAMGGLFVLAGAALLSMTAVMSKRKENE